MKYARDGRITGTTDPSKSVVTLCGKSLIADSSGALYWPGERTLIVADLHLEKGSSFASRGVFLPPYDTRQTLAKLARVITAYEPERVIALGDSFHDVDGPDRLDESDRALLSDLQSEREWIWITGNHDPEIAEQAGGEIRRSMTLCGLALRHQPFAGPATHEIAGHLHPTARISVRGHSVRRPCFASNGRRLVVPAFGSFTGGLNVLDSAFTPIFQRDALYVWMLGQEGIYPVASRQLHED